MDLATFANYKRGVEGWGTPITHKTGDPGHKHFHSIPFDFSPLWPLIVGAMESFRIRLLGGRTLDLRKWCWSWLGAVEDRGCWLEQGPDGFDTEVVITGAELVQPVVDRVWISIPSLFVLRSSLPWSPLSSSQTSSFLTELFVSSTQSFSPTVILAKHNQYKCLTFKRHHNANQL